MNILLLEPNYKSTYPPIGLMKMSYYHKEYRDDFVWLAKGKLPKALVCEMDKIKTQLEKLKHYSYCYDINQVYVGGILATLMPKDIEKATGIKPMTGLLTDSATLGYDDHINIDELTPDYSILDTTEYHYIKKIYSTFLCRKMTPCCFESKMVSLKFSKHQ